MRSFLPFVLAVLLLTNCTSFKGRVGTSCPCCTKELGETSEFDAFLEAIETMIKDPVPLLAGAGANTDQYQNDKALYQKWRSLVFDSAVECRNYNVAKTTLNESEKNVEKFEEQLQAAEAAVDEKREESVDAFNVDQLRELAHLMDRFKQDATRIAEKKGMIQDRQQDLKDKGYNGDRDLSTVERELKQKMEKKDELSSRISGLNKELRELNQRIATTATRVSASFAPKRVPPFSQRRALTDPLLTQSRLLKRRKRREA